MLAALAGRLSFACWPVGYGAVGEGPPPRLWVQEEFRSPGGPICAYRADGECGAWSGGADARRFERHGWLKRCEGEATRALPGPRFNTGRYGPTWRAAWLMPRELSRLDLELGALVVGPAFAVTEAQAARAGLPPDALGGDRPHLSALAAAFDRLYGLGRWAAGPLVALAEVRVVDRRVPAGEGVRA